MVLMTFVGSVSVSTLRGRGGGSEETVYLRAGAACAVHAAVPVGTAVSGLQEEQQKTNKFYHFALKGLEMLQRDVTMHHKVLYRQDERTEAILQETSRFGYFVRKIVWNRRFIVTLSFLGLFAHLFWIYLMFFK
jgi:hypothetical protein